MVNLVQIQNRIIKLECRKPVDILAGYQDRSDESLSICSFCKKIKVHEDKWHEIEDAIISLNLQGSYPLPAL